MKPGLTEVRKERERGREREREEREKEGKREKMCSRFGDLILSLFLFLSLSLQIVMQEGTLVTVTVDEAKKNECDDKLLYVDYTRLPKVRE